MADPSQYLAGEGSLWVQPGGPNTQSYYLGCHDIDGPDIPKGDFTPYWCPDPAKVNEFVMAGMYRGEPGVPTATINLPVGKTLDWLESLECPANIFLNKLKVGRPDDFARYERSHVLYLAQLTGHTYSRMRARTPGDQNESMLAVPFSFQEQYIAVEIRGLRQACAATVDAMNLAFCQDPHCYNGGPGVARCQYGVVVGAGAVAAEALIYFTEDGGGTWTITAADPFAVAEDIAAVAYFPYSPTVRRVLVGRSTTDAGNPAEVAYSDDGGATWAAVNVGATNGEFINTIFALDRYHIWAGTDLGYIYFSDDGGETWEAQEEGVITATDYRDIRFLDATHGIAVGDANIIAVTANGGRTWAAVAGAAAKAGDDILTCEMVTENRWFLGYDDGELYYTEDAGDNWAQRAFQGDGVGTVNKVRFGNVMVGYMLHDTAAPVGRLLRTRDGGYTWETNVVPANDGLVGLEVCGVNHAFAVGAASGGTAMVVEADV